jgi:hypothetical protein
MLYAVSIVVHVLVAVLAIGLVGAIPLTARFARQSEGQLVKGALHQVGRFAHLLTSVTDAHVALTLPRAPARLALQNKRVVCDLLFQASAASVLPTVGIIGG